MCVHLDCHYVILCDLDCPANNAIVLFETIAAGDNQ